MATGRILIVDDELAIRMLMADALADEGYSVETACNGRDGLLAVARALPDIILLDLNMPILDGWGFVKALVASHIAIPVILLSARINLAQDAADVGAVSFIGKPFELVTLLATVQRHCRLT